VNLATHVPRYADAPESLDGLKNARRREGCETSMSTSS
jgi:hypothetical protein